MRALADSQALVWYLADPGRLSAAALAALEEAESSDGIAVCAVTMPELWLATHKRSESRRLKPGVFELVKATIADPELNFGVVAITAATAGYFKAVPWPALRDPFDRFIVATSRELGLPLVSADAAIRSSAGDGVAGQQHLRCGHSIRPVSVPA